MANSFNQYFCGIAAKLCNNIQPLTLVNSAGSSYRNLNSFGFIEFTRTTVYNAINKVFHKDIFGIDIIKIQIVKEYDNLLAVPLIYLFNISIRREIFPSILKDAVTVLVYKSDDKTDMTNFRPIALLSVFSKIFEILIKERVLSFLLESNFFCDRQYAFLPGICTDEALIDQVRNYTKFGN